MNNKKTPSDSKTVLTRVVEPDALNPKGTLFGGILLGWMDELTGIAALRHCAPNRQVSTASILGVDFLRPMVLGDVLVLTARTVYTGRTSLIVFVDAVIDQMDGTTLPAARGVYLYVALGEDGKPVPVPELRCETKEEQAELALALRYKEAKQLLRRTPNT